MAQSKLQLVADWERQKEEKLVKDFQIAQQYALDNKQKLNGLETYRVNYLREAQTKAKQGLGAQSWGQHQQFIGKLDKACELQLQTLNQAMLVADQRRNQWLAQQRRRKAVELLIEKQQKEKRLQEEKQEQQMIDEISLQKFIRNA